MTKKRKPYTKGLPADYKGASPEQVAEALHRHRPEELVRHDSKVEETPPSVKSGI